MTRIDDAIANARRVALSARRALSADQRIRFSGQVCNRVVRLHEFMACHTVACYLPADDEVDPGIVIARAWRQKKRIYAPVIESDFRLKFCRLTPETPLIRNRYGLWEPVSNSSIAPEKIDLVITPLVAFDSERHRIGMGSGYFDRCFAFLKRRKHWLRPKLLGLAFECQEVRKIQPNHWDIPLYKVITEHR